MDIEKIKLLMKEQNISTYKLAKIIGKSESNFYELFSGKHTDWRISSVMNLAKALNVKVDDLLLDEYK